MIKTYKITVNGKSYDVTVEDAPAQADCVKTEAATENRMVSAEVAKPAPDNRKTVEISGAVEAPMPGKVLKIAVSKGEQVKAGQLLAVLEAMKMENEIFAPVSGIVADIVVSVGDNVNSGDALVVIA